MNRAWRGLMQGFAVGLLVLLAPVSPAAGQIGDRAPVPPSWNQRPGSSPTPNVRATAGPDETTDSLRAKQLGKLNAKHQEQAKADAAKLLELATSLNQQVAMMSGTTTSAKAITDTDKILALAKSIKGNLRQF